MKNIHHNDIQRKLKICHVITGLTDGGAEAVLYRLCTHDDQAKHVVISLLDSGKYRPMLEAAGIEVYGLGMKPGRLSVKGLVKLWRLLRSKQPDVVQTWMYHADFIGGIVARLAGISTVCWGIHNSNLEPGKSAKSTILISRLCAWLSHWIPHVIVSCSAPSAVIHQALGYNKDKFTIIPNGYNVTEFAPDEGARIQLRREWGINEKTILLGMVARYDLVKDHGNLLHALKLIKRNKASFQCILVGADIDINNQDLCSLIESHDVKGNVLLMGERSDIPAIMNALDIHILSSSSEGFPNVLAEAMACGTPCVTTDVGDTAAIVGDTGWAVPRSNAEFLANAILDAIAEKQDTEKWAKRKSNCRDRVASNFNLELMVRRYHNAWSSHLDSLPSLIKQSASLK